MDQKILKENLEVHNTGKKNSGTKNSFKKIPGPKIFIKNYFTTEIPGKKILQVKNSEKFLKKKNQQKIFRRK